MRQGTTTCYHDPNTDSGWLRVSLISIKGPDTRPIEELRSLLAQRAAKEGGKLFEAGDNIVAEWIKDSEQNGDPITPFWWAVGHYHEPKLSHEGLFSYTVLTERRTDLETLQMAELLGELISQAKFSSPKRA